MTNAQRVNKHQKTKSSVSDRPKGKFRHGKNKNKVKQSGKKKRI